MREAVNTLVDVKDRKTPLDMLLAFKSCIDSINDAITRNLKQHNLDLGACHPFVYGLIGYVAALKP